MILGIILAIVFICAILLVKNIVSIGLKLIAFGILTIAVFVTLWIFFVQPDMHKPFSVNTIEYLFKINKDGSLTTTKQTTHTIIKEVEK